MVHKKPIFLSTPAVATGWPYRGDPVVGAVGEMTSMKRRKLWKTREGGLCCPSSAIQTRLDPSSLLEEWSKTPIVFVVLLCCRLPPKLGETAKVYRIDRHLDSKGYFIYTCHSKISGYYFLLEHHGKLKWLHICRQSLVVFDLQNKK